MIRVVATFLFLTGLGVLGVLLLSKPIGALKVVARWPRFVFALLPPEYVSPNIREALRLIEDDPTQFARRFWYQVTIMRVNGLILLALACIGALLQFALLVTAE